MTIKEKFCHHFGRKREALMDITLIDKYVLRILEKNGWYPNRQFKDANKWIEEIERMGHLYRCFDYAIAILCELGGLTFREYAPMTYLNMAALQGKDIKQISPIKISAEIKNKCEVAYQILQEFHMVSEAKNYNGATFAFNALDAALDDDIVMDMEIATEIIGEKIFPIGSIEPDGIMYVTPKRTVYVVFNDSIFCSGSCIEEAINAFFLKTISPILIYHC